MLSCKHIKIVLVALLILLGSAPLLAQNNIYKIDDSLFEIYQRAQKLRSEPGCLAVGDTLWNEAVKAGDLKAQCIAKTIPVQYYFAVKDKSRLNPALKELMDVSRKNGYSQYVFYAYSMDFTFNINKGNFDECRKILDEMHDEAVRTDDAFGLSQCLSKTGQLWHTRQHYHQAVQYFVEAAELIEKAVPEQTPSSCYLFAADCLVKEGNYEKALYYADKAESCITTDSNLLNILDKKAECYYMTGNDSGFVAVGKRIQELEARAGRNFRGLYYPILVKAKNGDVNAAIKELDEEHSGISVLRLAESMYKSSGNYKAALHMADSAFSVLVSTNNKVSSEELAELGATLDTEKLKTENAVLERDRQRTISIFVIWLAALMLLIILILILSGRRLHKKNLELQAAKDKAERSENMKTKFVQNMSHEIRTPLNSVVGFSQLLAEDDSLDADGREEYSHIISENAEQLATLIDDILNISDIESGKYTKNLVNLHCNEICREAQVAISPLVPDGVALQFYSDVPDEFTVRADKLRVKQVLTNLLSNACKFTEAGTILITVSISENPGYVTFAVTDSGTGVPPDKADAIFERFEKLGSFKPGTGLGLPICRMIAKMFDGDVWLDTRYEDGGARFVFTLPGNRQ